MKKAVAILTLFFLLSFLCIPAYADTGSVKVIGRDGDDITDKNHEEGDDNDGGNSGGSSGSTGNQIINEPVNTNISEESILAAQTAGENALYGFTNGMIDSFYEGSMSIYQTDVSKNTDGTTGYNISVRELNPYEHPLVLSAQLVSFCFLFLVTIITILGSILLSMLQEKRPESFGDIRRNISGEYRPYNPNRVHSACVWSITRPVKYFIGFVGFIFLRNTLLNSMTQTSSGILGEATDNIIIRGITGIAMFVGSFQTSVAEYGVYTFGTVLFIICIITDILVLFNSEESAKKLEFVAWCAFGVFCLCDMINLFCMSYGVLTSQWRNEPIFITVGIVAGGFINSLILAILAIYVILKGKKAIGV